jgi:pyrroline-5-carboxylate reductase
VISIAAGISASDLSRWLGGHASVVRAMPNRRIDRLRCDRLYADGGVSPDHRATTERLLEAVGSAVWVQSEGDIDLVTAVSGSGSRTFPIDRITGGSRYRPRFVGRCCA